jgi:hypothetical protein
MGREHLRQLVGVEPWGLKCSTSKVAVKVCSSGGPSQPIVMQLTCCLTAHPDASTLTVK